MNNLSVGELMARLPQTGRVEWIGLRPARRAEIIEVQKATATQGKGLEGDRYSGKSGKRDITLIQAEHLKVIASVLGREGVHPALLRRNVMISGLNLLALKDKRFRIGDALLEYTGLCHPCSFMEGTFGEGGYNAVRGHGGITARVLKSGDFQLGDVITAIQ